MMMQAPQVLLYTKQNCPYCVKAKQLLKQKGVSFNELDIESDDKLREEMLKISNGKKTVPQIFINKEHIGGYDDLYALEQQGSLDSKLKSNEKSALVMASKTGNQGTSDAGFTGQKGSASKGDSSKAK
ncbi:Glutaredoxin-3 [Candidatus Hepatincolaceae symbiont of Richtersius coronifer]